MQTARGSRKASEEAGGRAYQGHLFKNQKALRRGRRAGAQLCSSKQVWQTAGKNQHPVTKQRCKEADKDARKPTKTQGSRQRHKEVDKDARKSSKTQGGRERRKEDRDRAESREGRNV